MLAGVIDQNVTHYLRGYPEEMRPVLPLRLTVGDEADIGFIDERRYLQRMARPLPPHQPGRNAGQFPMDGSHQLRFGVLVAVAKPPEHLCHVRGHLTDRTSAKE